MDLAVKSSAGSVVLTVLFLISGCLSSSDEIRPPRIDARAAGQQAIQEYDRDGDGSLSMDELERAPALAASMPKLDANQDGRVTADEVTDRIKAWQVVPISAMPVSCTVRLAGRPLPSATVTIKPEPWLGPELRSASGVTDRSGFAYLEIPAEGPSLPEIAGAQCGFFTVQISKQARDQELVPAKYNVESELGVEIAPDARWVRDGLRFELSS